MASCRRDWEPKMSKWQAEKAERNRQSLARLNRALPRIFPSAVLSWALCRPFVPPTPRLAVDSYWRAHPIRADRLARALASRSRSTGGWLWQLGENRKHGLPATYRTPPLPYLSSLARPGRRLKIWAIVPMGTWDSGTNA